LVVVEVLPVILKWHEGLSGLCIEFFTYIFSVTLWCFPPTYNTVEVVSDNNEYGVYVEPLLKIFPVKLISPETCKLYAGVVVFIPSLLFVVSQCNVSVVIALVP
jgi:hypothetical protein